MFKIVDGREYFYQWDLDRQIEVEDATITEVHFCNRTDDCSLVVEVEELTIFADGKEFTRRVANVPNIILQKSFDVRVFGYDGKATRYDKVFKVKPRTRPADYVYTETEVLSIKQLEEELRKDIDERLEDITDEVIDNLDLSAYYTKEETDEAIINSKDAYYLDFTYSTKEYQPATDDMIEFTTRFIAGQNVCAHVRTSRSLINAIAGWQPVAVSKQLGNRISLTTIGINPAPADLSYAAPYFTYVIREDSTAGWVYYTDNSYSFAIATTDYVDSAIENIDLPEGGNVDLSNYYTKEETDQAIYNSKDAYYIRIPSDTPTDADNPIVAEEDLAEFANRYVTNKNVCLHFYEYGSSATTNGFKTATIASTVGNKRIVFRDSNIDIKALAQNIGTSYWEYTLKDIDGIWYIYKTVIGHIAIATKDYVDSLFEGIATAEGGAY